MTKDPKKRVDWDKLFEFYDRIRAEARKKLQNSLPLNNISNLPKNGNGNPSQVNNNASVNQGLISLNSNNIGTGLSTSNNIGNSGNLGTINTNLNNNNENFGSLAHVSPTIAQNYLNAKKNSGSGANGLTNLDTRYGNKSGGTSGNGQIGREGSGGLFGGATGGQGYVPPSTSSNLAFRNSNQDNPNEWRFSNNQNNTSNSNVNINAGNSTANKFFSNNKKYPQF